MSTSDSDLDYDDPRFLVAAEQATASTSKDTLTYAERRKRTLAEQAERGKIKSRKQLEEEKREEGLSVNLIERERRRDEEGGEASTAFKMMSKMGYKPGEALGRKYDSSASGSEAGGSGSATPRGGLGFAKASFAPVGQSDDSKTGSVEAEPIRAGMGAGGLGSGQTGQAKTEPIRFEMRTARTGLGVPQAKRFRTYFSASSNNDGSTFDTSSASDPLPDLQGYLARVKSSMDERRAFGLLRSLRRTCEELDRRAGIEDSPMWRDPDEEEREQARVRSRKIYDRIDTELDSDDERKNVVDSADKAGRGKAGRGELAYEIGTSGTVVELDDDEDEDDAVEVSSEVGSGVAAATAPDSQRPADDIDEEAEWFSYDIRARLALTLTYLRNKYNYCFWCGELYHDADDLKAHCPGTEEEDH